MFGKLRLSAFRRNSTTRLVSLRPEFRRRSLHVKAVFFFRRRMSPF